MDQGLSGAIKSSYQKGSLRITIDYVTNLTYIYIYIYIYIYVCVCVCVCIRGYISEFNDESNDERAVILQNLNNLIPNKYLFFVNAHNSVYRYFLYRWHCDKRYQNGDYMSAIKERLESYPLVN